MSKKYKYSVSSSALKTITYALGNKNLNTRCYMYSLNDAESPAVRSRINIRAEDRAISYRNQLGHSLSMKSTNSTLPGPG